MRCALTTVEFGKTDELLVALSTPPSAVQCSGVNVHYKRKLALDKINLSILPGTVTAVIDPNGSGKSTCAPPTHSRRTSRRT